MSVVDLPSALRALHLAIAVEDLRLASRPRSCLDLWDGELRLTVSLHSETGATEAHAKALIVLLGLDDSNRIPRRSPDRWEAWKGRQPDGLVVEFVRYDEPAGVR